MRIIGQGIDIVEIDQITALLKSPDRHFENSCFTLAELKNAANVANRVEFLAGCFAAKESVLKALGTGWTQGIAWTDVELRSLNSGIPIVRLNGKCSEIALTLGILDWVLSISHCRSCAIACAIALG